MRFFQGFSSKAKVSSTIEKNDLYIFQKMLPINIKTLLKGIQSGEIEGNMDEDFHVNSDDYALEHNIFGRPLGGGKPEIDDKLVAGSEFVFDFFLGDVKTVLDTEASLQERILAGISIVPAGKVLKLARKIKNIDKVVKGGSKGTGKSGADNIALHAKYEEVLKVTESANPIVDSLRQTGKLPSNYVNKDVAVLNCWKPGKRLITMYLVGNLVEMYSKILQMCYLMHLGECGMKRM